MVLYVRAPALASGTVWQSSGPDLDPGLHLHHYANDNVTYLYFYSCQGSPVVPVRSCYARGGPSSRPLLLDANEIS